MTSNDSPGAQLRAENAELRARLEEAEETLRAIRTGEVEALIVETADGPQVFTLQGLDAESNRFRGEILAQVSDSVIAVDADQRVTYLNAAAERQYRVPASDALGRQFSEIYTRRWPGTETEAAMWAALREHGEWRGEIIHRTHDGREIAVETSDTALRDASGAPAGYVGVFRDISERKHSAAELQRVSVLLDTLLRTAPIGFCFLDRDLRYGRINERLAEINGTSSEAHLGRHVSEIVPTLVENIRDVTGRILVTGEAVLNHEFSGETPAAPGVTRFWNESWYPLRDGAGEVLGFGGIVEEITERKHAEEQLRAAYDSFRHLVEHSPFGVYAVDADFRLVQVSAGAQKVFENVRPLLGRDFAEVLRIVWSEPFASEANAIFRQVLESGEPYHARSTVQQRQDIAAVESYDWKVERITLPDGRPGAVSHFYDLSERLRYEALLRESETRMRLATEVSAVGIWEWNVVTDAVRWDAQMFRLYGIAPTSDGFVQYTDWSGAVLPEDLPETERILQDTVRRGAQSRRQFRVRRRDDGAVRHIEGVETVRANAQGEAEWVVGTNLDVTERKTAEIQLRQLAADLSEADRHKDEFLATLAHELRNPLAPIRNGLELMKMTGLQAAAVEQTRTMMDRQLTHMVRLIDDLMDVSRITRGNLILRKEHVPLAAVVNSAVEAIRPLIERMGQELTVTLPQQPLMVDADMTRLAQVFLNLLNNAAKYSDGGSHIQLNVERQGSDVVVTVKDTGIGIAADQLPRIFQMFTQVDRSLEMSQGGLGIGLTLVNRLVEMHGGRVEAMSEGPGKGSEFVVRLPIVVEASKPQESGGAAEHSVRSLFRILVVDDNRDGADSLSEVLKMMGNDTRTAYDGQAGVDAAGEFRPDVILLDIGLPKLNGYEACRRIREQAGGNGVVLIAVTGWGQDDDRRRSRVAGFDHHMVKPVDPQALMKMLAGLDVGHGQLTKRRT